MVRDVRFEGLHSQIFQNSSQKTPAIWDFVQAVSGDVDPNLPMVIGFVRLLHSPPWSHTFPAQVRSAGRGRDAPIRLKVQIYLPCRSLQHAEDEKGWDFCVPLAAGLAFRPCWRNKGCGAAQDPDILLPAGFFLFGVQIHRKSTFCLICSPAHINKQSYPPHWGVSPWNA